MSGFVQLYREVRKMQKYGQANLIYCVRYFEYALTLSVVCTAIYLSYCFAVINSRNLIGFSFLVSTILCVC